MMKTVNDKQFVFIIGAPRSGTTWLQIMLGAHPMVCTTVELRLFNKYTAPWIQSWNEEKKIMEHGLRVGLPFLWTEDEFYDFLRYFLNRVYENVLRTNPKATHILDKHPGYSGYTEDIIKLLPNSYFIHLIRDGRDVAVSLKAASKNMGFATNTIEKAASRWKERVNEALQARKFKQRYMEIRYEDLLTAGTTTMKSVFDFCGLSIGSSELETIIAQHSFEKMKTERKAQSQNIRLPENFYRKGGSGNWKEALTTDEKQLFAAQADHLLCELGYAEKGWCS